MSPKTRTAQVRGESPGTDMPGNYTHLLHMDDPQSFLDEVRETARMMHPDFDWQGFVAIFRDVVDLFNGKYPGFQACNTPYHNLEHTLDTVLAMVRLTHGVHLAKQPFTRDQLFLGLIAALMHDTGYIQSRDEKKGTGAKHAAGHEKRGAEFAARYLAEKGFSRDETRKCRIMILCTELTRDLSRMPFPCRETELMGKILGTVDILGQTAARNYLEKLFFLYQELKESGDDRYASELELIRGTTDFHLMMQERMNTQYEGLASCMRAHFAARWGLDLDIYSEYAEKNILFLGHLLSEDGETYRKSLKRSGIIRNLDEK